MVTINQKFVARKLGGSVGPISTQELIRALQDKANDEIPELDAMLLREAAERLDAASDLLAACKLVMRLMEEGKLVRDIRGDARPDWAMGTLELVRDLQTIQAAIFKAEARS